MEHAGRLSAEEQQQRRDVFELEAVSAHLHAALRILDRQEPAEIANVPDSPRARGAQSITATLLALGLVEEMAATLAATSVRIEAVPVKADLLELTVRMNALKQAFRIVVSWIARSNASPIATPLGEDEMF